MKKISKYASFFLVMALSTGQCLMAKEEKIKTINAKQLSSVSFFKNPNIEVKDIVDRGEIYHIKAMGKTPYGVQPFDAFVTKNKKYIFIGTGFLDTTGERLTTPYEKKMAKEAQIKAQEKQKHIAANIKNIEKDAAFVYGKGEKKFYIFTDPDCPYCKKMELMLPTLEKDAKFYIYFMPLDMHPEAKPMSLYVMGSENPMAALLSLADGSAGTKYKEDAYPAEKKKILEENLARQVAISQGFEVRGTPTVFDENGKQINWTDLPNILKKQ